MINFINNQKNTFLAISAMVIGVIFIDIHGLIVKYLGGEYSTIQLALFRYTFAIIPLILLLIYNKESSDLFKNLNKIFILFCFIRGSCFLAINILYYTSCWICIHSITQIVYKLHLMCLIAHLMRYLQLMMKQLVEQLK